MQHATTELCQVTPDCIQPVTTKKWGPAWKIDSVIVVIDPRVTSAGLGDKANVLRADKPFGKREVVYKDFTKEIV